MLTTGAVGVVAGLAMGGDSASEPAAAPVVTAVVAQRHLKDVVALECVADRPTLPISYTPPPEVEAVVTQVPQGLSTIANGTLLAEVAGRPVFVLDGKFPLYRDIRPGDTGRDVRMIQQALAKLGYPVRVDGEFGPSTQRAIQRLYRSKRYKAPETLVDATPPAAEPAEPAPSAAPTPVPTPVASPSATTPLPPAGTEKSAAPTQPVSVPYVSRQEIVIVPAVPHQLVPPLPKVGSRVKDVIARYEVGGATLSCQGPRAAAVSPGSSVRFPEVEHVRGVVSETPQPSASPTAADGDSAPESETPESASGQQGETLAITLREGAKRIRDGQQLRGEVVLADSGGPVLTVPVAAVGGAGTNGTVEVRDGENSRQVDVKVGTMVDGMVQVTPLRGELREGDTVVVSSRG